MGGLRADLADARSLLADGITGPHGALPFNRVFE